MQYVEIDRSTPSIPVVRLNRPERRNSLSATMMGDIADAFRELDRDRDAAVVVLTGAGDGFCSGADLQDIPADVPASARERGPVGFVYRFQAHLAEAILSVHECEKPVVAAVHGVAYGGGLGLALASDLTVATPSARFSSAFIRVGLSSLDAGVSYFLPRIVGAKRAAELMLTGREFSGVEADRFGMLNVLAPEGEHLAAAMRLAEQLADNSEYGLLMTKRGLWTNVDAPSIRHALEIENRAQSLGSFTDNFVEAEAAFRDGRRKPVWKPM